MTTRRNFLKALAATALAPFVPAIAAAPKFDALPFERLLSGEMSMAARLAGPGRVILDSFKPINLAFANGILLSKDLSFGAATQTCTVSDLVIEFDGVPEIWISLDYGPRAICPGDTITACTNVELNWA